MSNPGTVVPTGALVSPGGQPGVIGLNSFNATSSAFIVPAVGATVNVTLSDATWVVVGEFVYVDQAGGGVGQAGIMQVTAKAGNQVTLLTPAPTPIYPLADTTQSGLLRQISGNITDFVDGTNHCQTITQINGFLTKTGASTLTLADRNKYIICSGGSWTLTLPAASVGLCYNLRNDQGLVTSGTVTLQPQSGTIDNATSITLLPAQECTVVSDGTNWRTFGLKREIVIGSLNLASVSSQIINLPAGYGYFEIEINRLICSSAVANLQMKFSADGVTFSNTGAYGVYYYNSSTSVMSVGVYTNGAACYVTHWIETSLGRHMVNLKLQPGDASSRTAFIANSGAMYNAGNIGDFVLSGFYDAFGPLAAIQLFPSAGQISAAVYVKGIV